MSSSTYTPPLAPASPNARTIAVQVIKHTRLTRDVYSITLARPNTRQAPAPWLPGQFITLVLQGNNGPIYRSYSLCSAGNGDEPWVITFKRVPGGLVSTYLADTVTVGTTLQVMPPRGTFTLPTTMNREQTLVFIAIGTGITPIRGMLQAIAALPSNRRPRVQLHYASRSADDTIFRDELARLDPQQTWLRQWHYLRTNGPRMTPEWVFSNAYPLSRAAQWYICGPEDFNRSMRTSLKGVRVQDDLIHVENFADQSKQGKTAGGMNARMTIRETGTSVDVRAGETLLDALERHGYQPEFGCRSGSCGTCQLHVLKGNVRNPGTDVLSASERREGIVLGCIAVPASDLLIDSGGIPPKGTRIVAKSVAAGRRDAKNSLRLTAAIITVLVLLGIWLLTNHTPVSSSASSSSTSNSILVAPTDTPAATSSTTNTSTTSTTVTQVPTATATPVPVSRTGSS